MVWIIKLIFRLVTKLFNRFQLEPSPPDDHFSRHCGTKIKYGKESADRAVASFLKKRNQIMEAYKCQYCDGYHIGHPKPKMSVKIGKSLIRIEK